MLNFVAIAVGGALGSLLRHLIFVLVQRPTPAGFPYGTLAANLLGCLGIGFLWYLLIDSRLQYEWRLFLFTGLLGGFTTFSTLARETTDLIRLGEWKSAVIYLGASNVLGILLVFAGMLLARRLQ